MSDKTGIEWTDATWNPTVGCTKVSAGCDHCYAENLVNRFAGTSVAFPTRFDTVNVRPDRFLTQPLRWRRPRRIFVNSLSDLFHKDVPTGVIARVFAVMAITPHHTYQLLTKRHGRMKSLLSSDPFRDMVDEAMVSLGSHNETHGYGWPLPNLWVGVSVEDQATANLRIPALLDTPATVRFLSCEPLLGPVSIYASSLIDRDPGIDWVIVGGESGPGHRWMHPQWARLLRDECNRNGTSFLFKQWGGRTPKAAGRELDGRTWDEYPAVTG